MIQKKKLNIQKVINYRPLFFIFLAFFFGILSARKLFAGNAWYIVFAVVGILGIIVACALYKRFISMLVLVASFFVGIGFYFIGINSFVGKEYTGEQTVVARATDNINEYGWGTSVVLDDVYIGGEPGKCIMLSIYNDTDITIEAGDVLTFRSYVNQASLFELGDFETYLFRNNTPYKCGVSASDITLVHGNVKADEKVRLFLKQILQENMPEDSAALAFSALTGNKSLIEEETKDMYKLAGIVHLLTVSGLHISFLTALVAWILKKCRVNKYVNLILTATFLILYCFVCGFTPSVVRASIMGLVLILAPIFGREYDPLTSLGLAGMIILLISPLSAFDGGFLMSFFSVLCIFMLYSPLSDLLKKILPKFVANSFAISLSAQIGILPFLAMYSGTFNPLTIFANLLVIPFFGLLFPFLFIASLIAMIPYFGWILLPAKWGFFVITKVAEFFAGTKLIIELQPFDSFLTILIFVAAFTLSYFVMVKGHWKVFSMSLLILIGVICFAVDPSFYNVKQTSITYLSSGSAFLTNEKGQVAFVGTEMLGVDKKWLRKNKISKVNFFFMLGNWDASFVHDARKYGALELITVKAKSYTSEEVWVDANEWKHAGDYEFMFHCDAEDEVGLEITFDNRSFFFTTNSSLSYNNVEYLKEYFLNSQTDLAVVGKHDWLCQYIQSPGLLVGKYNSEYIDYSSIKDGNLNFTYDKKLNVRRID